MGVEAMYAYLSSCHGRRGGVNTTLAEGLNLGRFDRIQPTSALLKFELGHCELTRSRLELGGELPCPLLSFRKSLNFCKAAIDCTWGRSQLTTWIEKSQSLALCNWPVSIAASATRGQPNSVLRRKVLISLLVLTEPGACRQARHSHKCIKRVKFATVYAASIAWCLHWHVGCVALQSVTSSELLRLNASGGHFVAILFCMLSWWSMYCARRWAIVYMRGILFCLVSC